CSPDLWVAILGFLVFRPFFSVDPLAEFLPATREAWVRFPANAAMQLQANAVGLSSIGGDTIHYTNEELVLSLFRGRVESRKGVARRLLHGDPLGSSVHV